MSYAKNVFFLAAPEESPLLDMLVKLAGAKKAIEIGEPSKYI